jgi:hypothetical protein
MMLEESFAPHLYIQVALLGLHQVLHQQLQFVLHEYLHCVFQTHLHERLHGTLHSFLHLCHFSANRK